MGRYIYYRLDFVRTAEGLTEDLSEEYLTSTVAVAHF